MKFKSLLLLAFLLLITALAHAQTDLSPTVARLRAEYPPQMTPVQVGEMLNRIAWTHRAEGWGLLRKTGGSRCPAPQGGEISCDILIHAPSTHHFDVLADQENAARPTWLDKGPCVLGPSSGCAMANYLAPIQPAQSSPEPQPTPTPAPDLSPRVAALESALGEMQGRLDALLSRVETMGQTFASDVSTLGMRVTLIENAKPLLPNCFGRGRLFGVFGVDIECRLEY